jgi:hypothetical protein
MQAGVDLWVTAGYVGMTVETPERKYGHHHPDFLAEAVEGISHRPKKAIAAQGRDQILLRDLLRDVEKPEMTKSWNLRPLRPERSECLLSY